MPQINPWSVLSATVAAFVLGGVWYSPLLFAKAWMSACGLTEEELKGGSALRVFGGAFLLTLIMALNLAAFLGPKPGLAWGAAAGALAGFGWLAMGLGVLYLFERRPLRLWLINGGYLGLCLTLMGAILGLWP